jgi:hypothetical protein
MILARHVISALGLALLRGVATHPYCLKDTFKGRDFFDNWTWETLEDPTHGNVNYIDKSSAERSNMSYGRAFAHHQLCYGSYPHVSLQQQICNAR